MIRRKVTRVFKSGHSFAVRLPAGFHFNKNKQVEILKRGDEMVIREIPQSLEKAFELLIHLPEDFFSTGRKDTPPQKRKF